jgi:hypothetical protein
MMSEKSANKPTRKKAAKSIKEKRTAKKLKSGTDSDRATIFPGR